MVRIAMEASKLLSAKGSSSALAWIALAAAGPRFRIISPEVSTAVTAPPAVDGNRRNEWDQGKLLHLLPTVSHDRILIKASFGAALAGAPELRVGEVRSRGRKNSALGDFWQFDVTGLKPQTRYRLALT